MRGRVRVVLPLLLPALSGWAEWHALHGAADAASRAERDRVIERAELRRGDTVLDVGAGLGLLTFAALDRIGDGWVFAVDPSVDVIEELLRLAHEAGAAGIAYQVGSAEVLPLPDATVDVVLLRSVLIHVGDAAEAVREIARVLRPGGRVSLREPLNRETTYVSDTVDWSALGVLGARVVELGRASIGADPLARWGAAELEHWVREAGLVDVDVLVDDPGEEWLVTIESVDARLDALGGPNALSLRQRWQGAFAPDEVDRLVAHLRAQSGATLRFRRPQVFLRARRP